MKTYILIFDVANYISGASIYYSNKIKYLKEKGWNVIAFSSNKGKVYVETLKEYSDNVFEFISCLPSLFSNTKINKYLNSMKKKIQNFDTAIIETGTDYTAYWGELLAKEINAKHVVFLLDEYNDRINFNNIDFWKFKYNRKELFCISENAINKIFGKYNFLNNNDHIFNAYCSNSIENIESSLEKKIQKEDYNIATIGRLEKKFVINIVNSICEFANKYKNKKILFYMFGGSDKNTIKNIKKILNNYKNIKYFITGYIWPIPLNVVNKFDLFISGAGSVRATSNLNIPTISIDVHKGTPNGIVINNTLSINDRYYYNQNNNILNYMEKVLIKKEKIEVKNKINLQEQWNNIINIYETNMEKINLNIKKEYYDVSQITTGRKSFYKKKKLYNVFGYKLVEIGIKNFKKVFRK